MEPLVKRSSPIGVLARDYLVSLIKQEDILHNKLTDGRTVLLKKQAWARITSKFNAGGYDEKKTEYQLMKIWERVKGKVRYEQEQKRKMRETKMVLDIIGSSYDSDAWPPDRRLSEPLGTTQASKSTAAIVSEDEAVEPSSEPVVIESLDPPQLHNSSATVDKDSMFMHSSSEEQGIVVESLDSSQPHSVSASVDKHSMFTPSSSQQQRSKRNHASVDGMDLMSKRTYWMNNLKLQK